MKTVCGKFYPRTFSAIYKQSIVMKCLLFEVMLAMPADNCRQLGYPYKGHCGCKDLFCRWS